MIPSEPLSDQIPARAGRRCECYVPLCGHRACCDAPLNADDRGQSWDLLWLGLAHDAKDCSNWLAVCRTCLGKWSGKQIVESEQIAADVLSGRLRQIPLRG